MLARGLARLDPRHPHDRAVQTELNWAARGVSLPPGLELRWLGTAGFLLRHEQTTLLIDPFLTRRSLPASLRTTPLCSDPEVVARLLDDATAVLVGHTHFDHAVDVPEISRRFACPVYGSSSLRRLMALHGAGERCVEVTAHRPYEIGPFTVRFVPSQHSRLLAGLAVPQGGELTCDHLDHLGLGAYRCGQVWGILVEVAGTTIYHQGSANLIDEELRRAIGPEGVDVFLCGIAGRSYTPRFTRRALGLVRPGLVVAHHHDDFFRPVDAPLAFSLNVHLEGFVDEVAAAAPHLAVRTLEPLQTVSG